MVLFRLRWVCVEGGGWGYVIFDESVWVIDLSYGQKVEELGLKFQFLDFLFRIYLLVF